jgi:hypothetical protein
MELPEKLTITPKDPTITPKVYTNKVIEDLYETAKKTWVSDDGDPEEFDWEQFAIEIEDLSNHKRHDAKADYYHWALNRNIQTYRNKINGSDRYSLDYPTNAELAQKIRKYANEQRETIHIPAPEGYKTVPTEILERSSIMEKEWARANGYDSDEEDDDANEDWYEALKNV